MIDHTLRLVLDSLGRSEEYEFYIKKFQSQGSGCFALFCPDTQSIQEDLEHLLSAMHFLQRLELFGAVVLHTPQAVQSAQRILREDRGKCLAGLPIAEISQDLIESVQEITKRGQMPLLYSNSISLKDALPFYTANIAKRLHFLRLRGPLQNAKGEILLYANHSLPYSTLSEKDRALFALGKFFITQNPGLHISVSTSFHLLKEIFTVKGAGTILRLQAQIRKNNPEDIPKASLLALLKESFSRPLKCDFRFDKIHVVYHDEHFRGAIFLEKYNIGFYMSKFAVGSQARGLGIGQDLWEAMIEDHPRLFWRSRARNSINRWYMRLADGMQKVVANGADWHVFWKGVATDDIPEVIRFCRKRADDFV